MLLAVLLSIMAGAFGVFQAGLNKEVAQSLGYTNSLLFNGVFFLIFNFAFFMLVFLKPHWVGQEFNLQGSLSDFKLWWLLPGLLGFSLVMGLAVSVGKIGATQTFVITIAAQIIASLLWDLFDGTFQVNKWKLIGAVITMTGAILSTLS